MLANNWSPLPLCLLALEAMEPAEEAIKRSIYLRLRPHKEMAEDELQIE